MRFVLKELRRHSWRTVVSISGYAAAVCFILIAMCITGTNKEDSFGILQGTGTHFIVYIPANTNCCTSDRADGSIYAEGVNTRMLDQEMIHTIRNMDGIRDAAPYLLYRMYHKNYKTDISIGGIDTNSYATKNNVCAATNLIAGKFLSANPDELVAEESFAVAHNLAVGDSLFVFGGKMKLAGIINSGIKPAKADFYAPIGHVRTILKDRLKCRAGSFDMNIILVEVANARHQDRVIRQVKNTMYKFTVSSYNCYEPASKVMSIIEKTSTIFTVLILIFLFVFSAKTQLAALMERFREIGILKSLGWSDFKLSGHIILVSLVHSIVGVTVGLLLGTAILFIMNRMNVRLFDLLEFHFQGMSIPIIFGLSILGGIIASIPPVLKTFRTQAGDIMNNYL
jgi:ABC-type lipoprotein release transport system permease subunit